MMKVKNSSRGIRSNDKQQERQQELDVFVVLVPFDVLRETDATEPEVVCRS